MVLAADCPPVFFYDPMSRAVGIAHSGWKGTAGRIAGNVVEAMVREFGSRPQDIQVVIGPGVGPCCYNVRDDVIKQVESSFPGAWQQSHNIEPLLTRDGLVYFNLWAAIKRSLLDVGVTADNISSEAVCTAHNTETFYSHRGEEGKCGLFGAVIGLRNG
jgi:YfiH family protein